MNRIYLNLKLVLVAVFSFIGMSVGAIEVTDVLNQDVTGVTGTTYTSFSDKQVTSDAIYAGQCAGDKSSIQLRSNNNNSGVITTTSGGVIKKVVVVWNEGTNSTRELNIYGSNSAYENAADLYSQETQGTLIGTLKFSEATEGVSTLEVEDSYSYIGFRSKSGALYLTSVSITWESNAVAPTVQKPTITPAAGTYFSEQTVTITAEEGVEVFYTLNGGDETKYESPFTVSEDTEIVAYAKKGEDKSAETKATLTFGPIYTTFAAANEAATADRIVSRLTFTEALVTFVSGQNTYIQDATSAMLIYGTTTLKAGDKITGNIDGQLYTYNGLPEVANPTYDVEVVSSDNEVTPKLILADDLAAHPMNYVSQYVAIRNAVFEADAEGNAKANYNFTAAGASLVLRNNFQVDLSISASSAYAVSGLVTVYNSTVQVYPTAAEDIVELKYETANLDFEATEPITDGICTYAKDMSKNGTVHFGAQPVDGWNVLNVTDNIYEGSDRGVLDQKAGGVFEYGSDAWLGGAEYKAPAAAPEGSSGTKALGLVSVWGGNNAIIQYTQDIVLDEGSYELEVVVMNTAGTNALTKNLIGFIAEDGTEYLAKTKSYPVGEWTTEVISFTLDKKTFGQLSLGLQNASGSGAAPHLFIDGVAINTIAPTVALHKELADALIDATATVEAKANVGDQLFQKPEDAYDTFAGVVSTQKEVSENAEATEQQLRDAIAALQDAVATYAAAVNAPEADAEYSLQLKDGGMYMSLNEGTNLSADPAPLKFVAVEGGYAITDGNEYVACTGTGNNVWSMGVATEPYAWVVTLQDGYYHIAKASNSAQHIGVDNTGAGSACYADKGVSDKSLWTIAPYVKVEPVDVTDLIKNPAYLENGYDGWTYSENGFKPREYEAPMNLITYNGNAAFEVSQTIENVPAGLYKLTVNAFYRAGSLDDEKAKIAAGTELEKELTMYAAVGDDTYSHKVMNLSEGATDVAYGEGTTMLDNGKFVPNSAAESRAWYIAGEYTNEVLFNVFEDGSVTIGLSKNEGLPSDYCPIGAWQLYRLGDADAEKAQPDVVPVDPVQQAYEKALAAVEDGGNYRIFTAVEGKKYYVTADGLLTNVADDGGIFTITKVTGGSYKEYGYKIDSGSKRFTNPPLMDNVADLTTKVFATTTNNRNDWEAQVLFLNEEGMYAIRSCNTADATSSWGDAGRTYWTYVVEEAPTPQYTYELTYNWMLESVVPINVTYALVESDGTTEVKSVTKKQVSYSAVSVPSDLTSSVAYDYDVQGTIGEEDCTIKVVRSFKAGVVHTLADLSNSKAYTIRCDRGALLTTNDYLASTAHGSLTQAEAANFAVISYEDHYYLYSVADNKFVTNSGALADELVSGVEDAIILEAKTDPYFLSYFIINGAKNGLNTNGNDPYGYVINTWMTADAGNQYYLIEAADFDATEALAILEEAFHPEYAISIAVIENGTVQADKTKAKEGETVTLTITPAEGYILDAVTVMAGEEPVTVTDNTFVMPAGDVTISATFVLPDSISALAAEGKAEIFDLNGRKVSKVLRGGIYIINGKRVAVK